MRLMEYLPVVVGSYLLGALPSAYLVGRARGVDIFAIGSGNMGATNVARALGTGWGVFVALMDVAKGTLAVWLAGRTGGSEAQVLAAIYVVLGHNWSLLAALATGKLRGGKGAATSFGALLAFAPAALLIVLMLLAVLLLAITRWSSFAMLVCYVLGAVAILALAVAGEMHENWLFLPIVLSPITLYRYRGNIQRLWAGEERRIGERLRV